MSVPALDRHQPVRTEVVPFGPGRLAVGLSRSALSRLEAGDRPALQMELLFSCLVRKRLLADEQIPAPGRYRAMLDAGIELSFRPVVARHCDADTYARGQPLDDLPLAEGRTLCPRWLYIDYHEGQWQGDFGFAHR